MQDTALRNLQALSKRSLDVNFDLVNTKYKPIENIGTGAYGVVCSAVNKKTGQKVAIKKIPDAFDILVTAKRTYRELKILKHFKHDNVIAIKDILMPSESLEDFKDVYVVLDLMESDLHQIIHSQQQLTDDHCRYFLYQILRGVKYIHSGNVIHRDLKPSNLLVDENCDLKIGDFGMARGVNAKGNSDESNKIFMTAYVATRWYRAPELLCYSDDYTHAVDIWSIGCIFAEMLNRQPLFRGKNFVHQMDLITEVLGTPPDSILNMINSDQVRNFFRGKYRNKLALPWKLKFPKVNNDALDLLTKMLMFDPACRIDAEQALKHPYLAEYHTPNAEPICNPPFDFSFEKTERTKDEIKGAIMNVIKEFHKPKKHRSVPLAVFLKPVPKQDQDNKQKPLPGEKKVNKQTGSDVTTSLFTQWQNLLESTTKDKSTEDQNHGDDKTLKHFPQNTDSLVIGNIDSVLKPLDVAMKSSELVDHKQMNVPPPSNLLVPQIQKINDTSNDVVMKSASLPVDKDSITMAAKEAASLDLPSTDVVMLSAKGEGAKDDLEGEEEVALATSKDDKKLDSTLQKTVSMDTKALIKAALLNSAMRNRMKEQSGNICQSDGKKGGQKQPVTAAARQREREEKRRQKLQRSMERQKKLKEKKKGNVSENLLLTESDRQMLERWNKMRKVTTPFVHPIRQHLKDLKDLKADKRKRLGSNSQLGTSAANQPTITGFIPITSSVGQVAFNQPLAPVNQTIVDLNQSQHCATLSQPIKAESQTPHVTINQPQTLQTSVVDQQQPTLPQPSVNQQQPTLPQTSVNQPALQTIDIDQLQPTLQASSVNQPQPNFENSGLNPGTRSTPLLRQTLPVQLLEGIELDSSVKETDQTEEPSSQPCQLVANPESSQFVQQQSLTVTQPNQQYFPTTTSHQLIPSSTVIDSQIPITQNVKTALLPRVQPTSSTSSQIVSPYEYRTPNERDTPSPPITLSSPPATVNVPSPPSYSDAMEDKKREHAKYGHVEIGATPLHTGKHMNSYPSLCVSTDQPSIQLPDRDLYAKTTSSPPDIAMVTKQLSRNIMEDTLPPSLQLTPKGDGSGYGLGFDIDELLHQSLGVPPPQPPPPPTTTTMQITNTTICDGIRLDSAPLSASLIADWLDVRHLDQDDMVALQQELGITSPVTLGNLPDFTSNQGL
ncbi:uncharacterized protein LOC144449050 [Glandiceps talaboti]